MVDSIASTVRPALRRLADSVRNVVRQELPPGRTASLVAARLQPFLACDDLLHPDHLDGDSSGYVQHLLHAEEDGGFSVVALVWLPGQSTPVHDHVAWCVTGVYRGTEHEQRYELVGQVPQPYLVPAKVTTNDAGSVCGFAPPGDIHRVSNAGDTVAASLHVYGADITRLSTSIRRTYDLPVRNS